MNFRSIETKNKVYWLADLHCANCHNIFYYYWKKFKLKWKITHTFVTVSLIHHKSLSWPDSQFSSKWTKFNISLLLSIKSAKTGHKSIFSLKNLTPRKQFYGAKINSIWWIAEIPLVARYRKRVKKQKRIIYRS